ncbi:MAG: UDP-N-acetylglucosamine 2-epimerase, partial [Candidatus Hermodarchaeota archaeon]
MKIIHIFTGQHYDTYLADIFFRTLELEPPKHQLNVRSGSTDYHILKIIKKIVPILKNEELNGIIIPGDTNSALAGALAGNFLSIPVIHLEAGLRSNDLKMREEINRRLIDHGSSVLFAPTKTAMNNLRVESVLGKAVLSGDTMYDLLASEMDKIRNEATFNETTKDMDIHNKNYLILTIHRQENLKNPTRLQRIFKAIERSKIDTVFPIHPHTKKIINMSEIKIPSNVR